MLENQNIEWKQGWHNDYIKWICGFANARGGTIYIGKDDLGRVTGLLNSNTLMDIIPNKIRNLLGIICEVNLHEEDSKSYLEIITQPYSVPVSLRGRYYYRSGSTKMELIGNALNEFLLAKSGNTWDNVLEPGIDVSEIDEASLSHFLRDAIQSGRMPDISGLSIKDVLDKLRLYRNGKIKRAAIILFGKDPNRYYPNVVVKIGRFGKDDADLRFQETLEGNLMIADICFKAGYIDSWGRGTLKIIKSCKDAGLPEPVISELNGGILVTLYKNIFTTDQLRKLGLNDRQINVVKFLKTHKSISNSGYQDLNNVRKTTATEELSYLVDLGILNPAMIKGRGAYYTLK